MRPGNGKPGRAPVRWIRRAPATRRTSASPAMVRSKPVPVARPVALSSYGNHPSRRSVLLGMKDRSATEKDVKHVPALVVVVGTKPPPPKKKEEREDADRRS